MTHLPICTTLFVRLYETAPIFFLGVVSLFTASFISVNDFAMIYPCDTLQCVLGGMSQWSVNCNRCLGLAEMTRRWVSNRSNSRAHAQEMARESTLTTSCGFTPLIKGTGQNGCFVRRNSTSSGKVRASVDFPFTVMGSPSVFTSSKWWVACNTYYAREA